MTLIHNHNVRTDLGMIVVPFLPIRPLYISWFGTLFMSGHVLHFYFQRIFLRQIVKSS